MARIPYKTFKDEGEVYYYIHRHLQNFIERDSAVAWFQEQKEANYQIMKSRFARNYLNSISDVSRNSLSILDSTMRENEIIGAIDKQLLDTLNNNVSQAINNYNFDEKVKTAYNSLNDFIKTQDAKALDKVFAQITAATELLSTSRGELVSLIGQRGEYKRNRDLNKLYALLQEDLATLEGKTLTVNQSRLLSVKISLANLVNDLANKKFDRATLAGYLRNIFSTQIGEYIVSKGVGKGLDVAIGDIRKSLTGAKNIEVDEDDQELQNLISLYGQKGTQVFKTDNSFKDLSIQISSGDTVDIDLGLSTKWYKRENNGKIYDAVFTRETSFVNRLEQMLNSTVEKYYAYNALELADQASDLYSSLKSALVARNLDVMMSGLGVQGDFSQFLVINGEFYSIWEIINAVEHFNIGQGSYGRERKTDPITISATGLSKVIDMTRQVKDDPNSWIKALMRAKAQNIEIANLSLTGHFYPNRLRNILTGKTRFDNI